MPRNRKIPVAQYPTGLPYGQLKQRQAQVAAVPPGPAPTPRSGPAGPAAQVARPAPDRQALAAMFAQLPDLPLRRPTERPNEPVTAGLEAGPGRGPLGPLVGPAPPDPARNMLRTIAEQSGDPEMLALAAFIERAKGSAVT